MRKHLKYASYIFRHKWFVYRAGRITGAPLWALIKHDLSKFSRHEWPQYVHFFYNGPHTTDNRTAFQLAWLHHLHSNPHHWQHWILRQDDGQVIILKMPTKYVREMVADWAGAGRAITGSWDIGTWYKERDFKIQMHSETRRLVERLINELHVCYE